MGSSARTSEDKEWQDLQRDHCWFPAWTNYIYGPDTRSDEVVEEASEHTLESAFDPFEPNPEGLIPSHIYSGPEFQPSRPFDASFLSSHAHQAAVPSDSGYSSSPALSGTMPQSPTRNFPTNTHNLSQAQASLPGTSSLPHSGPIGTLIVPSGQAQSQPKLQTYYPIIRPHEVFQDKYALFRYDWRVDVNHSLAVAWENQNNPQLPPAQQATSRSFIFQVSEYIGMERMKATARAGMPKLWQCLLILRTFPQNHPSAVTAFQWSQAFLKSGAPSARAYIGQIYAQMEAAHSAGQDPLSAIQSFVPKDQPWIITSTQHTYSAPGPPYNQT